MANNTKVYRVLNIDYSLCTNVVLTKRFCVITLLVHNENGGIVMAQATVTFRIPEEEKELVAAYAEALDITLTDLYRNTVLDKIESELDLKTLREAMEVSRQKNESGVSQDEMEKLLDEL